MVPKVVVAVHVEDHVRNEIVAQVGRQMPQIFKETAEGGLAVTPTAQRLSKEILEKQK